MTMNPNPFIRLVAVGMAAALAAEPATAAMGNEPWAMGTSTRVARCPLPVAPSPFGSQALKEPFLGADQPILSAGAKAGENRLLASGLGAYSAGDFRRTLIEMVTLPEYQMKNFGRMAGYVAKELFHLLMSYPMIAPAPIMRATEGKPLRTNGQWAEDFIHWLYDRQGEFDGPYGFVLSHALRFLLRLRSRPLTIREQLSTIGIARAPLGKMTGLELTYTKIPEQEGEEPVILEAVAFRGTDREVRFEFEIVDHELSYRGPDRFIGAMNLAVPEIPGEQRYAVLLENHLRHRNGEMARAVEHEVREVILRSLGYPVDVAHKKALLDAKLQVSLETYRTLPRYDSTRQSSGPGADHHVAGLPVIGVALAFAVLTGCGWSPAQSEFLGAWPVNLIRIMGVVLMVAGLALLIWSFRKESQLPNKTVLKPSSMGAAPEQVKPPAAPQLLEKQKELKLMLKNQYPRDRLRSVGAQDAWDSVEYFTQIQPSRMELDAIENSGYAAAANIRRALNHPETKDPGDRQALSAMLAVLEGTDATGPAETPRTGQTGETLAGLLISITGGLLGVAAYSVYGNLPGVAAADGLWQASNYAAWFGTVISIAILAAVLAVVLKWSLIPTFWRWTLAKAQYKDLTRNAADAIPRGRAKDLQAIKEIQRQLELDKEKLMDLRKALSDLWLGRAAPLMNSRQLTNNIRAVKNDLDRLENELQNQRPFQMLEPSMREWVRNYLVHSGRTDILAIIFHSFCPLGSAAAAGQAGIILIATHSKWSRLSGLLMPADTSFDNAFAEAFQAQFGLALQKQAFSFVQETKFEPYPSSSFDETLKRFMFPMAGVMRPRTGYRTQEGLQDISIVARTAEDEEVLSLLMQQRLDVLRADKKEKNLMLVGWMALLFVNIIIVILLVYHFTFRAEVRPPLLTHPVQRAA